MAIKNNQIDCSELHDHDFYSWAKEQAVLLKTGQANLLDLKHLAEEFDAMGASQELALESAIREALLHLLKLKYSPAENHRNDWLITVSKQRTQIECIIRKNPGLKCELDLIFQDAWRDARKLALFAARVYSEHPNINENSPFTLADVRNDDFFPPYEESLITVNAQLAFAFASDDSDQELGALADAAKGAADRAGAAIDDAMEFTATSNKRIANMEASAARKPI